MQFLMTLGARCEQSKPVRAGLCLRIHIRMPLHHAPQICDPDPAVTMACSNLHRQVWVQVCSAGSCPARGSVSCGGM